MKQNNVQKRYSKYVHRGLFVFFLLSLVSTPIACNKQEENPSTELYWQEDHNGNIITNDIQKLRAQTQLSVIVPAYLPEGLSNPPYIEVTPDYIEANDTKVNVQYTDLENHGYIFISEYYYTIDNFMDPSSLHPYSYISVGDKEVLEEYWTEYWSSIDKTEISMYLYKWQIEGTNIKIEIGGYEQAEAIKIVQSMIGK